MPETEQGAVWNSLVDYLNGLVLELYRFRRQLKTLLFAHKA